MLTLEPSFCFLYRSNQGLAPQTKQETASSTLTILLLSAAGQVGYIGIAGKDLGNVLLGLNATDLNQTIATLGYCLRNGICCLCFSLGADDICLPLLLCFFDYESSALGLLLGNLLLLDGLGEFSAKSHVGDGNILQGDVELGCALHQVGLNSSRDGFSLGDELGGVELSHDGFEDFIANGWKHTLIVILTKVLREMTC
jgi:hypothetical protein